MEKIILNYTAYRDMSGNNIYKSEDGIYFSKDHNTIIYIGRDIDNDPWGDARTLNKYKDVEFITTGDEDLPTEAERFNYMMLGRLQMDCEYYLGNGNKYNKHLYYQDEQEHINRMKELYNRFTDDKKPEWLTLEQITEYEKAMITG